jgi:hypothetical protein
LREVCVGPEPDSQTVEISDTFSGAMNAEAKREPRRSVGAPEATITKAQAIEAALCHKAPDP